MRTYLALALLAFSLAPVLAAEPVVPTEEVVVNGAPLEERGFTTTEQTTTLRGIPAPVLDTPRSVQTVNRDLIETRQVQNLQETVQGIPGVVRSSTFANQGEAFLLRGFLQ